jgi:radical S-adenosyl methionine domain-containing protein 2
MELSEAKKGMRLLAEKGLRKLNFAGGEPFLYPKFVGELAKFCKEELKLENISVVTNGSKLKEKWFEKYGSYINILAVSCDSCDYDTNKKIGRSENNSSTAHLDHVRNAARFCKSHGIQFKVNTVVNAFNWEEDMNDLVTELEPCRWKVFQVLKLDGENSGENS